jgi:hypothetical protein
MQFAHNGIELKPIPFVEPEPAAPATAVAKADAGKAGAAASDAATPAEPAAPRPVSLSLATTQRLTAIEELMRMARPLKPVAEDFAPLAALPSAVAAR